MCPLSWRDGSSGGRPSTAVKHLTPPPMSASDRQPAPSSSFGPAAIGRETQSGD